jgi:4-methyl-5(b-hydroxyethyl)-thiazole monophosphate biosynthesis
MVLIALAEGFEELEAVTPYDVLKRGGVPVQFAGVSSKTVGSLRNVNINCEIILKDAKQDDVELLILPGGMPGVSNLGKSQELKELILTLLQREKKVAAICAAPSLLAKMGLLKGKNASCNPSVAGILKEEGANVVDERVYSEGSFITSIGPGSAAEFSFEILKTLKGSKIADNVRTEMLFL